MTDIVVGRAQLRTDIHEIAGFGDTEKVFAGGYGVRPGIAGVELYVVGKPLRRTYDHAVVMGGARVLIGADCCEDLIGPRTIEKESRMRRVRKQGRSIDITLTKQSKTELPDV